MPGPVRAWPGGALATLGCGRGPPPPPPPAGASGFPSHWHVTVRVSDPGGARRLTEFGTPVRRRGGRGGVSPETASASPGPAHAVAVFNLSLGRRPSPSLSLCLVRRLRARARRARSRARLGLARGLSKWLVGCPRDRLQPSGLLKVSHAVVDFSVGQHDRHQV